MSFLSLKTISTTGKGLAATLACVAALGTTTAQAQTETLTENAQGTHDGFFYSFWKDNGDASFGLGEGGRYTSQWSNATNNWVGGKGWNPGGRRVVNYSGSYNVDNSQNSYLALYGWTRDPLIEYYVIESYGSYNPSSCTEGRQTYGTFESDGATYEIVRCERIQQPSIDGTQTFYQYFSVRQPKKGFGQISGTITVGNHFDAWAAAGLNLGNHDYQVLATEGYQSTGSSDITVSEGSGGDTGGGDTGGDTGGSDGGTTGSGDNTLVVRAVGTSGSEQLRVNVGGSTIETLSLSTSWQDFTVNTDATGDVNVELFDDQGEGYEIRVDYVQINGDTRYAEDQSYNTSAYEGECGGGSNTQWMHCDGVIGFGDMSGGTTSGGGSTDGTTTSGDCYCDWYGSDIASCENQDSGWGWENNQSCIGNNTCNDQGGGGGVVCN